VAAALFFLMAPLLVLGAMGMLASARRPPPPWRTVIALVVASTTVWLVYVGLYQHETPCNGKMAGCSTVFGYDAPLPDEHIAGIVLLLAGFLLPALWVGWRRLAPPWTTGASLAVGPTVLAWWTAPRGDNDGLWVLVFLLLPALGGLAVVVAAVAERVGEARAGRDAPERGLTDASPSDRLSALAIDLVIAGAALAVPVTLLSDAKLEVVAAVVGFSIATAYLAVPIVWKARTLGQSLVGLCVLDSTTGQPVSAVRAVLRSVVVVLEVAAVPSVILAIPALVECVALVGSGRTVTDRVLGTVVLSDRRVADHTLEPATIEPA
jgi:hypothetical protein